MRAGAAALALFLLGPGSLPVPAAAQAPGPVLRIFISVDMEGIAGIGTGAMTRASGGKDYAVGRRLMTDEVNAVIAAILERGPAEILVNDSHGDHQNVFHTELDPRVTYIQGAIKPLGMVQGLDGTFDGVIFLGYHARAGDPGGFLAHTGSGSVKGLWLNGVEVGEGGMNAAFAGMHGVPVILAAGDSAFTAEITRLVDAETVTTKTAETPAAARLLHPAPVRDSLAAAVVRALDRLAGGSFEPMKFDGPVDVRMRFASPTHVDILRSIPGVERLDGYTVTYRAGDMDRAYRIIRLMYRFVRP